jgi:hypothetical protein
MKLEMQRTPDPSPTPSGHATDTGVPPRIRATVVRPYDPSAAPTVPIAPEVRVPRPFLARLLAMTGLTLFSGCDTVEAPLTEAEPVEDGISLLSPREQLIRLSIDLRGFRPTEAELTAIDDDPELYEAFVERWLTSPAFPDQVADWFHLRFLTRTGELGFDAGVSEEAALAASAAEEPLDLVRAITRDDLPWTEIVLADHTFADDVRAWLYAVDRPEGAAEGVTEAWYADGREHAGVLSMSAMWTRYPSTGVNGNRHRANAISRILLCDDYLARPVAFARAQVDAMTSGDPEAVIRDNPTCQSCHASLDPLAANFFGFWWEVEDSGPSLLTYRPEDEPLWREHAGKSPAYHGRPTHGLRELASALANDDRLAACAVQTVFEGITQRELTDADREEMDTHERAFRDAGLKIRDLVRSIVHSRPYRAGEDAQGRVTAKTVSPAQLEATILAKTGYRWRLGGQPALSANVGGLAVLSGGIDARYVVQPSYAPSVGLMLVHERLAQAAARHVVTRELVSGGARELLRDVTLDTTPDSDPIAFEAQIRSLYLDITGLALPDEAPEIASLAGLWRDLHGMRASNADAWAGVLSVVLRDPHLLFY